MTFPRIALLPLALGLFIAAPGLRAAEAERETFAETFDVRVINLEVVVEDADGKRVEGLGIGDFEILVDGKSQPVEYFSEIRSRNAAAPGTPAAPGAAPARPPGLGESGRLTTNYVVFLDLATGDPRRAVDTTENVAAQLGQIPPEDRVAVFVFDGRRLENIADWRDSREKVLASLSRIEYQGGAFTTVAELEANDRFRERDSDLTEDSGAQEDLARRVGRELEGTFTALSTTLRTAAPPPGRRVALAFAGAWPRDLAAYLGIPQRAAANAANRVRDFYPIKAYSGVYETANLLGYTLYTVDLAAGSPVSGTAQNGGLGRVNGARAGLRSFDRNLETDTTLLRYAEQTGGKAFTSGFGDTGLATVQDDLASFYWLGFSPQRQANDKSHSVEVRVRKPGLKVRSRKQYSDLSRQTEVDQELESRLLFGRTRAKQDFTVLPGEPQLKRAEMVLPITLRIPLDLVAFLPKGNLYAADLELRIAAIGEGGERSPLRNIPVKLEGPKPQTGQYATYETQLRLRKDNRRFVLGLYDKQGDRLLVSTVDLDHL